MREMTLFGVAYTVLSGDGGILGSRLTQRTRMGQLWAPGQSTPLSFRSAGRPQTGSAERLLQGDPLSGALALLPRHHEGKGRGKGRGRGRGGRRVGDEAAFAASEAALAA